jgi:uncharacterized phosphatase
MTLLCIVRHGETDWNKQRKLQGREDRELNEKGREQASLIAACLGKSHWDVIITSPLKRAFATAEIIGKNLHITNVVKESAFIERDFGRASGLTLEQQESAFPDGLVPGKESDDSLLKRVMQGLNGIVKKYGDRKVILVAHGAVINSLLKAVSGGRIDVGETNIKNMCINIVEHDGSNWHVKVYNSVEAHWP